MEDEEFEKVFDEISHLFDTWFNIDYNEQRKEMKKILEEIESNSYEKAIQDFNDLANGKISIKEAKP